MANKSLVIKVSSMEPDMQEFAVQCTEKAISSKNTDQEIAAAIRESFDEKYPATWHVLVGRSFGCFVTHEKR